ncbi:AraC family transcriptional regulator [Aureibaculum luteum]|uniref:AraC family transcriptional regulator n=1 Tax=Aureibaculum luteum TaxID=1548456 RepID=UPI000E496671|nr:AraC family transcriptional regulator [Aureibaculum luteum]
MNYFYKIALLLLALIFFSISDSYAQDLKDNLKEYEALSDSITKYKPTDNRLSIDFAKRQLLLAEKGRDTVKIIQSLHFIGRNSQFISEFKQSIEFFERELALISFIDVNEEKYKRLTADYYTEIEILAQLGQNYVALGQFNKALKLYDKCVAIAEKENLEFYKAIMPTIIADLYATIGNYRVALKKNKESYEALKTVNDVSDTTKIANRGFVAINISNSYLNLAKLDSALWILDEGLKEKLDTLSISSKQLFVGQRGEVYLEKKEYQKALNYLLEAHSLAVQYDSVVGPASYSLELAECYFYLKNYQLAIDKLEQGLILKKQRTKEIHLTEDYKLLAKIYKQSGNLEKSNENFEKYILNQTALEKSKDTITSAFHTQEVSNLEKEKSTQKNTFYLFMSIGLGLLVLLITFIIYLIKEKKKNTEKFNVLLSKFNQEEKTTFEIIDTKDKVLEEKISAEVNEETTYLILAGLQSLKEQEYFLRQDCNSYNVAKKIKTNTSYLSKVINSHFEKNFNTYINDLRINYAILRLKNDSRFRSFSVQSIAEEIGYKSADSFARYFKLSTGLNPSFYIKQLNSLD